MTTVKRSHQEYMEIAVVLGKHVACELILAPDSRAFAKVLHFLTDKPRCPMCLDEMTRSQDSRMEKE